MRLPLLLAALVIVGTVTPSEAVCSSDADCDAARLSGNCIDGTCVCRINRWEPDGTSSQVASDPTCSRTVLDLAPTLFLGLVLAKLVHNVVVTSLCIAAIALLRKSERLQWNLQCVAVFLLAWGGFSNIVYWSLDPLAARGLMPFFWLYLLPLEFGLAAYILVLFYWRDVCTRSMRIARFGSGRPLKILLGGSMLIVFVIGLVNSLNPLKQSIAAWFLLAYAAIMLTFSMVMIHSCYVLNKSLPTLMSPPGASSPTAVSTVSPRNAVSSDQVSPSSGVRALNSNQVQYHVNAYHLRVLRRFNNFCLASAGTGFGFAIIVVLVSLLLPSVNPSGRVLMDFAIMAIGAPWNYMMVRLFWPMPTIGTTHGVVSAQPDSSAARPRVVVHSPPAGSVRSSGAQNGSSGQRPVAKAVWRSGETEQKEGQPAPAAEGAGPAAAAAGEHTDASEADVNAMTEEKSQHDNQPSMITAVHESTVNQGKTVEMTQLPVGMIGSVSSA